MYVATIVRDRKDGHIYVRLAKTPQDGGNVDVVDILNGDELKELKDRAERYASELEGGN